MPQCWQGGPFLDQFALSKYLPSSLLIVYSDRSVIELDPEYQRIGGVWTREKRQLLIDSLINGFDVPKLYFHEFVPPKQRNQRTYRYAIIDGKQRIQTIWDFIEGKLQLAEDFEYLRDDSVEAGGLDYQELATRYPHVKARFDGTPLDIITIRTTDLELVEDLFSRLNEAVPLNAPEKRAAFGGPLPIVIKKTAKHTFLTTCVPFPDQRYRHRDLAAKFLYIEYENRIVNTKKANLDAFVKDFKRWRKARDKRATANAIKKLMDLVNDTLNIMESVFVKNDSLLRQVGMVTVYYYLFRSIRVKSVTNTSRKMLDQFEIARRQNRERVELEGEGADGIDTDLLEFDKHSQTPNDAYAIRIRLRILLRYLKKHNGVEYEMNIIKTPD